MLITLHPHDLHASNQNLYRSLCRSWSCSSGFPLLYFDVLVSEHVHDEMLHGLCFDGLARAVFFQEMHIAEAMTLFPRFENAALRGSFRAGVVSNEDARPGPKRSAQPGSPS